MATKLELPTIGPHASNLIYIYDLEMEQLVVEDKIKINIEIVHGYFTSKY